MNPHQDEFAWTRIGSVEDAMFQRAFDLLWAEFGPKNEMETRDVLARRFDLAPLSMYELVLVEDANGDWAAVCDYTIMRHDADRSVVIHFSHALVAERHRRAGLAKAMMCFALERASELVPDADILLVAEAEHDDGSDPLRRARLRAFERIGLRVVDPSRIDYHQPDFNDPEDPREASPLRMLLLLLRAGDENAPTISGSALRQAVAQLYGLYAAQFRASNMAHPALSLASYPAGEEPVKLLAPTALILNPGA